MTLSVVKSQRQECNSAAVELLRELLEMAEGGEIESLIVVAMRPDAKFLVKGSRSMSQLESVGALEFAKHDIMGVEK